MAAPKKDDQAPAKDDQAPAAPAKQQPPILAFFERIGLVKGNEFQTVVMTSAAGRSYIGPVIVEDIAAIGNQDDILPSEIVVTFAEPGMKARHRVRYSELVHWTEKG